MTGKFGVTTVPLPSFWSSAGNSGEHRKVHPCQNPRCAASKSSCTATTYHDPPAKRRKQASKKAKANALLSTSSNGTPTVSERSAGIKGSSDDAKGCADCHGACASRSALKPEVVSAIQNSYKGSTGRNSKGSTSPMSSSYISTPTRVPANLSKVGLDPSFARTRSLSTGSSSPDGGLRGPPKTATAFPRAAIPPAAESQKAFAGHELLTISSPQAGRVAPPNSESDEGEEVIHGGLPRMASASNPVPRTLCTIPACNLSPSRDTVACARHTRLAPSVLADDQMAPGHSSQSSGFAAAAIPQQPSTSSSRALSAHSSPSSLDHALRGRHGPSKEQSAHGKITLAPTKSKGRSRGSSTIAIMPTMATVGSAAQVSVLEQKIEEEDCKSLSSERIASVASKESCSTEVEPISGFCDTLYTPKCTLCGNGAFEEVDLSNNRHRNDRRLMVALEIAVLSVLVSLLVIVFYPIFMSGWRSHWHGCCECRPSARTALGTGRNSGEHYSQVRGNNGWLYRGFRNLLKCPMSQQEVGSFVIR